MGKAYANRKPVEERPESDFYQTPKSLTWGLIELDIIPFQGVLLEPAYGEGAIYDELKKEYRPIIKGDIKTGQDFLKSNVHVTTIVTNPPFSLFDEFVLKAKEVADEVFMIGKTNFFGAYQREKKGVWKNLKHVYIFNRQVDYRSEFREDGKFKCGNLITGWFHWSKDWNEPWWKTSIIDVQKYVLKRGE